MKRICTICARGGSKGVKGKNLKLLNSKPLIAYSIEQAINSGLFDAVAVSSDSDDILKIATQYGATHTILRPNDLATDTAPKIPVIKHCATSIELITGIEFDIFVDLDCTSPLRSIEDIEEVVRILESDTCSNIISGCVARRSPYFNLVEENESGYVTLSKKLLKPVTRRQDSPKCYDMNASIYAWKRASFIYMDSVFTDKTKIYVMPEDRSHDIDTEFDFKIVEMIMRDKNDTK